MKTPFNNLTTPMALPGVAGAQTASPRRTEDKRSVGALRFKKLLVPVDLSRTSLQTLQCGVRLAEQFGGTITVLHVVARASFPSGQRDVPGVAPDEESARAAARQLSRWARHEMTPARCGEILVRIGNPVHEILQAAQWLSADLIVMFTHDYTGMNRRLLHSVTERVVRNAPCPILALHERLLTRNGDAGGGPPSPTWSNILVPVDFTPCSLQALRCAVIAAAQTRAKLTLLHVVNLPAEVKTRSAGRRKEGIDLSRPREEMRRLVERQLDSWAEQEIPSGMAFEKSIHMDAPATDIVAQTAQRLGCDLIVMGNHHYSWWKRAGQADTAERVVRTAPCPVLSVPESAPTVETARSTLRPRKSTKQERSGKP